MVARTHGWIVRPHDGKEVFRVRALNGRAAAEKAKRKLAEWEPEPRVCGFDLVDCGRS